GAASVGLVALPGGRGADVTAALGPGAGRAGPMAALALAGDPGLGGGGRSPALAGADPGRLPRCAAVAGAPAPLLMLNALGVGVDLVEVERARQMLAEKGSHVYDRLLAPGRAVYCRTRLQ